MTIQGIEVLNFWVPGPPKTKGSLTARAPRCHCCPACRGYVGQPQLRDSVGSGRWRKLVAYQARAAMAQPIQNWPSLGTLTRPIPVAVDLTFGLSGDVLASGAGDLDKLYRNVLDALTDAGVYEDDVQVVRLSGSKSEDEPGVRVRVVI